jgi:parallel beta helix pectate lyase-like protein
VTRRIRPTVQARVPVRKEADVWRNDNVPNFSGSTGRTPGQPLRAFAGWLLLGATTLLSTPQPADARLITILPLTTTGNEEFETLANTLVPGDTLMLHGGTYSQNARRAITCAGTASAPIVIMSYPGENAILTRPADNIDTQNNIEIVSCSYLVLKNLHFQGGSSGMRVIGGNYLTIEGCEIYETGNNAIAVNSGTFTYDGFVIRGNHIHHTGLSVNGTTEGEGMYLGCNDNVCRITNALIEGNYIHHTRGTSDGGNDGIEVKYGSGGNIIRNNVIHDTNIGRQYPGIFVYGGGAAPNIVEGNAIWNAGEAIQVVSDAVVRNNLIFNSSITGITASSHSQVPVMKNVTIVNNTIYGNPQGVYVRWSGATNMTLANNAIYSPGGTAVDASGLTGAGITVKANYVEGSMSGASLDNNAFFAGGTAASAFVDPASFDFWPKISSPLRAMAQAAWVPANDFNQTTRTSPYEVGAYETEGQTSNPGWRVGPGFKSGTTADTIPPSAPTGLRTP